MSEADLQLCTVGLVEKLGALESPRIRIIGGRRKLTTNLDYNGVNISADSRCREHRCSKGFRGRSKTHLGVLVAMAVGKKIQVKLRSFGVNAIKWCWSKNLVRFEGTGNPAGMEGEDAGQCGGHFPSSKERRQSQSD